MNLQRLQLNQPQKLLKSSPLPEFSKFVIPALAVLTLLGTANSLLLKARTYQTNLLKGLLYHLGSWGIKPKTLYFSFGVT